jgi:hypothetical protein
MHAFLDKFSYKYYNCEIYLIKYLNMHAFLDKFSYKYYNCEIYLIKYLNIKKDIVGPIYYMFFNYPKITPYTQNK